MGFTISKMFAVPNENEQEQQLQQLNDNSEMEILSTEMEFLSVPDPEHKQQPEQDQRQQIEEEYDDGLVPGKWWREPIKIVCEDGVDRSDTKVNY